MPQLFIHHMGFGDDLPDVKNYSILYGIIQIKNLKVVVLEPHSIFFWGYYG